MIIKKKMAVINVKHKKDMLLETVIDDHIIKIDVPESMGEKNRSPLLLSSLSFDKLANPTRLGNLNTVNN